MYEVIWTKKGCTPIEFLKETEQSADAIYALFACIKQPGDDLEYITP